MTDILPGLQMSLLEILLVCGAVVLTLARWFPAAARRPMAFAGAGLVVLPSAALCVAGMRWQSVPVMAGGLFALPFAVAPLLPRRSGRQARRVRWWLALPGSAVCLGLIAAGPAAAWALPRPDFPAPSGQYTVGTTVVQWTDMSRPETATTDPHDHRDVVVQLWYPAAQNTPHARRAPYLGRTRAESRIVSDALADSVGVPGFVLDGLPQARSRAYLDVPPVPGHQQFPVVLFSPGAGGVRTQNTALAEELASHGYVVAGLDHPYDSAAVLLDDGRVVRSKLASTSDAAEGTRGAVAATAIRAADLSFVLTELGKMAQGQVPGPLVGRLDLTRAAVTGHSYGGSAALQAARQDPRFAAVIDLDGYPHDAAPTAYHQPALALVHTIGGSTADYHSRITKVLGLSTAAGYRLTVPGSSHLTFTDAPLYLPPYSPIVGGLGRTGSLHTTAGATLAFLDHVLGKAKGDTAQALKAYGNLTVLAPHAAH
ncbi:alpha/beta hydrolase family protein [Actinacidiphila bryophytorum]|uniref:alpha/beta hydrolase family protein n=1 Tax=Actinacidiphila bryophytorum TaxID=1436133 RepID=UPI002176983E|nr:hypothetical protein [Actinacidiphila bryophytorum]UWE08350.1 hypothetical protein NYE86_06165 [Actinacidiphila bryophytorum]